jgi:hypothetical protein
MDRWPAQNFRPAAMGVTARLSRFIGASSDRLGSGYPGDVTA